MTPSGVDQIISALIGLAVMIITTLGPRLLKIAQDWLEARDPGGAATKPIDPDDYP